MILFFWPFIALGYVAGFLLSLAIGSWVFWEVSSYTNMQGERNWAFPKNEDMLMIAFVSAFFWWLFILPALGFVVIRLVVKTKITIAKKEVELLEFNAHALAHQHEELDALDYQGKNRHRLRPDELSLSRIHESDKKK